MAERLQARFCYFDGTVREYDSEEAHVHGIRHALDCVLEHFWTVAIPDELTFGAVCSRLLAAEGVVVGQSQHGASNITSDAIGRVLLREPAGFRRFENWAFEFKLYREHRVSVAYLRDAVSRIEGTPFDVLCLLTTDDVTSFGSYLVTGNPHIRVWDRTVLNYLVGQHPEVLREYFNEFPAAVVELG